MSRPRKSQNLKKLEGNRSHRRPQPRELKATGMPIAPSHLTEEQLVCWRLTVLSLPKHFLGKADEGILERLACSWARLRESQRHLNSEGDVITNGNGLQVTSPWLRVNKLAAQQMDRYGTELGLSPRARRELFEPSPDYDANDPLSQLMELWERERT